MKTALLLVLSNLLLFMSCKNESTSTPIKELLVVIENIEVLKKELVLHQLEGIWYYKNEPFNGYAIKLYPNNILAEKVGFYKGKREGIAKKWSENGVLRLAYHYKQNRLAKTYKSWWENGVLASVATYKNGRQHGEEKKWYSTGQLAKKRHLIEGQEQGLQKAWLKNGKLYVNYEAKNGRIFGMKRANSCYKLENEVVIRN